MDRNWNGQPCDAQGNLLNSQSDGSDFYDLTGPQSGTVSNTYPPFMVSAALAYPSLYGDYLYAANPTGATQLGASSASISFPSTVSSPNNRVGVYTPGFASAFNYGGNGEGSYSIDAAHGGPSSGPINGSVTTDMSGQLVLYFKMHWYGSGPAPTFVDFLVSTWVYAQASADYESTQQTSGLSVKATATIDAFKETASASTGGRASSAGGLHLVRAAVDPNTGIAEVYVNGTAHWVISNTVPYRVRNPSVALGDHGDYTYIGPAVAYGGSFVRAGAKQDSRDLTISAGVDVTNTKQVLLSGAGVVSIDANGDQNFFQTPNTRTPDGTMHGDTIYTYVGHHDGAQDAFNTNWIYFTPNYSGNWHYKAGTTHNGNSIVVPNVVAPDTWKWSPSESQDGWDYGLCEMSLAPNYAIVNGYAQGQDAPSVYNVGYSATDNTDQANASANYMMTLHDPVEKNYPDHKTSDFVNPRQVSGNLISSGTSDTLGGGIAIQIDYSLSISLTGPEASWVAKVLGLNVTASVEQDYQTISNVSTTGLPAGWYTSVVEYDHYYDHVGKTDGWSTTGYTGTDPYYIREIPSVAGDQWGIKMAAPTPPTGGQVGAH